MAIAFAADARHTDIGRGIDHVQIEIEIEVDCSHSRKEWNRFTSTFAKPTERPPVGLSAPDAAFGIRVSSPRSEQNQERSIFAIPGYRTS